MQAVIRPTSGISDEQSRKTSPVQSRRWSSCVKAWLAAGNIARQKARLEMILKFRTLNRSIRIVAPKSRPTLRLSARRFAALESIMIVSSRSGFSRFPNDCAPEFSIGGCASVSIVPPTEPTRRPQPGTVRKRAHTNIKFLVVAPDHPARRNNNFNQTVGRFTLTHCEGVIALHAAKLRA